MPLRASHRHLPALATGAFCALLKMGQLAAVYVLDMFMLP